MDRGDLTGVGSTSLVDRIKGIILKPKEEWPKIEAEPSSQSDILTRYVLPLAAIGPVATFLGGQIFGYGGFGLSIRPSLMGGLGSAVISFILTVVGVFILALIADWLAPKFGGQSNRLNAFKLVAYGATAVWLAQVFALIPALSFFTILGLYSIYLFYTGTIPMMKVPEDRAIAYTAVTFLCAFVLNLLVGLFAGGIAALLGLGAAASLGDRMSDRDEVEISIPGVGTINTGKMEEAAERMEKVQKGEIKAVPTDALKTYLPESIGDFARTGTSAQAMGHAGTGVEGTYKAGDYSFKLRVRDMLALSGLAGIGSAMGIEQEREDENGYERIGTVDGQWRSEKWNIGSERGSYGVMIADRFQVEADGNVPSIDVLKAAVAEVDADGLEDLAD